MLQHHFQSCLPLWGISLLRSSCCQMKRLLNLQMKSEVHNIIIFLCQTVSYCRQNTEYVKCSAFVNATRRTKEVSLCKQLFYIFWVLHWIQPLLVSVKKRIYVILANAFFLSITCLFILALHLYFYFSPLLYVCMHHQDWYLLLVLLHWAMTIKWIIFSSTNDWWFLTKK